MRLLKGTCRELKFYLGNDLHIVCLFYVIVIVPVWLRFYLYQMNPDGVSMVRIAENYASGNFSEAINGYWSPMLSWLMAPFIRLYSALGLGVSSQKHLAGLLAAKSVLVFTGLLCVAWSYRIARLLSSKDHFSGKFASAYRWVLFAPLALVYGFQSISVITGDLLAVLFLLMYLELLLKLQVQQLYLYRCFGRVVVSMSLIVVGGYYSKSYLLPFFLAYGIVVAILNFKKKAYIKLYIMSSTLTMVLIAPWIALISKKYGFLTISTSGGYNRAVFGPNSMGHPFDHIGVEQGAAYSMQSSATSFWYDPSLLMRGPGWSVWESWSNFKFQLILIYNNLIRMAEILIGFQPLFFLLVGLVIIALLCPRLEWRAVDKRIFYLLVTLLLVFPSGYYLVCLEERYVWILQPLLLFLMMVVVRQVILANRWRFVALAVFAFMMVLRPMDQIIKGRQPNKYTYELVQNIQSQTLEIVKGSSIITDLRQLCYPQFCRIVSADSFVDSNLLAYQLNGHLVGYFSIEQRKRYRGEAENIRNSLSSWAADFYVVNSKPDYYLGKEDVLSSCSDFRVAWSRDLLASPPKWIELSRGRYGDFRLYVKAKLLCAS